MAAMEIDGCSFLIEAFVLAIDGCPAISSSVTNTLLKREVKECRYEMQLRRTRS